MRGLLAGNMMKFNSCARRGEKTSTSSSSFLKLIEVVLTDLLRGYFDVSLFSICLIESLIEFN